MIQNLSISPRREIFIFHSSQNILQHLQKLYILVRHADGNPQTVFTKWLVTTIAYNHAKLSKVLVHFFRMSDFKQQKIGIGWVYFFDGIAVTQLLRHIFTLLRIFLILNFSSSRLSNAFSAVSAVSL